MSFQIKKGILQLDEPINIKNKYSINSIDLNHLNEILVHTQYNIKGIHLNNHATSMSHNTDELSVSYRLAYTQKDGISLIGSFEVAKETIFQSCLPIDMNNFINQLVEQIKTELDVQIPQIKCIHDALLEMIEKIHNSAFENNILLSDTIFHHKIEILDPSTQKVVGIANRIKLIDDTLVLMEYISLDTDKEPKTTIDISVNINENTALMIKNVGLHSKAGKEIKYCQYNIEGYSTISLHNTDNVKCEKLKSCSLEFPTIGSIMNLNSDLHTLNEPGKLINFYKQNKNVNTIRIDINKYLLG